MMYGSNNGQYQHHDRTEMLLPSAVADAIICRIKSRLYHHARCSSSVWSKNVSTSGDFSFSFSIFVPPSAGLSTGLATVFALTTFTSFRPISPKPSILPNLTSKSSASFKSLSRVSRCSQSMVLGEYTSPSQLQSSHPLPQTPYPTEPDSS